MIEGSQLRPCVSTNEYEVDAWILRSVLHHRGDQDIPEDVIRGGCPRDLYSEAIEVERLGGSIDAGGSGARAGQQPEGRAGAAAADIDSRVGRAGI